MSNELLLATLLFARMVGLFILSPLFAGRMIPRSVRLGFALACSLSLAPSLSLKFNFTFDRSLLFIILILQEAAIGYLIGFVFSLVFEAAGFAGQLVGTLTGLSATELFDPLSSSHHPLLARFFSLFVFTLFLVLDLHHPLLRLLFDGFSAIPPGRYPFTWQVASGLIEASSSLFYHALQFAMIPLFFLLPLIALFAIISRFFPIFWLSFPLQLLVGLVALGSSAIFFAPILEHAFLQLNEIVKKSMAL